MAAITNHQTQWLQTTQICYLLVLQIGSLARVSLSLNHQGVNRAAFFLEALGKDLLSFLDPVSSFQRMSLAGAPSSIFKACNISPLTLFP